MAGELTQHEAIQLLFSNQTWGMLPSPSEIDQLPVASEDYMLVRHWGSPNIWVSLMLFMLVRVSGCGSNVTMVMVCVCVVCVYSSCCVLTDS